MSPDKNLEMALNTVRVYYYLSEFVNHYKDKTRNEWPQEDKILMDWLYKKGHGRDREDVINEDPEALTYSIIQWEYGDNSKEINPEGQNVHLEYVKKYQSFPRRPRLIRELIEQLQKKAPGPEPRGLRL